MWGRRTATSLFKTRNRVHKCDRNESMVMIIIADITIELGARV